MSKALALLSLTILCAISQTTEASTQTLSQTPSLSALVPPSRTVQWVSNNSPGTSTPSLDTSASPADDDTTLYQRAAWAVGVGVDVWKARTTYLELRYFGQRWSHWDVYFGTLIPVGASKSAQAISPRVGVELYETWLRDRLTFGLGLTLAQADDIVGTPLRYELRFSMRLMPGLTAGLVHESNCQRLCANALLSWMPRGTSGPNWGYNFFVLELEL